MNNHIIEIARAVRRWTEERDDMQRHPTGDLCGFCAIAAAHLWRELKRADINAEIHVAEMAVQGKVSGSHCYVVVDDNVVDVTATQFNEFRDKPVVVIHSKEAEVYAYYNTAHVFNDPSELRRFQKKNKWHADQIAYEEVL